MFALNLPLHSGHIVTKFTLAIAKTSHASLVVAKLGKLNGYWCLQSGHVATTGIWILDTKGPLLISLHF
jgi:hypothetical protein